MENDKNFEFDKREKMIEEIEKVTPEMVNEFILEKMRTHFGRICIKFMSKNHENNTAEIEDSKQKNKEFYN